MASRKLSFNLTFVATALLLLGIVVLVNAVIGTLNAGRFDVTEDRLYTLSPAAKRILSGLQVPVQVKFYVTSRDEMPTALNTLERDVVDKLKEFKVASGGKLDFALYDPSKDEDLAEKIAGKGIRPFQVQSVDRDEIGLKLIYSAIEVAYKEKDPEIIPQVFPETLETLEYEICGAVTKLARDADPIVAVYASKQEIDPQLAAMFLQAGQQPPAPQEIYGGVAEMLRGQRYDVRQVEITAESPIPDDAATLVILAPRRFGDRQRYEVNRFLQRGGNVILAVQRLEYNYQPGRRGGFDISATQLETGAEPLLREYGVPISEAMFMDNSMEVLSIPRQQNLGGLRLQVQEPVKAPMQILVAGSQLNDETSITNKIGQLLYLWGSRIEPDESRLEEQGLRYSPLFTSSDEAWEIGYRAGSLALADFTYDPDAGVGPAPLAVLVSGDFPNPYEQGAVPQWNPAQPDSSALDTPVEEFASAESNLLVVGSAKMFDDNVIRAGGNGLFLLNAIDALTLGEDLIQVRAKTVQQRMLEPVSDRQKLLYRMFATGLVPVLVAVFGITRMMRRRREEAAFLAAHSG